MSWSYQSLNLRGVKPIGGNRMQPGRHCCVISNARIAEVAGGIKQLQYEVTNEEDGTSLRDGIAVHYAGTDDRKKKAVEIGHQKLRLLLELLDHPNPDQPASAPGGLQWLNGKRIGIIVDPATFRGEDGKEHPSSEIRRKGAPYFRVAFDGAPPAAASSPSAAGGSFVDNFVNGGDDLDDDIPF